MIEATLITADTRAALAQLTRAATNLKPLFDGLASDLETTTRERFDLQAGPDGTPWIPSQAALGLAPRASGGIRPGLTLVDTADLLGAITSQASEDQLAIGVEASGGAGVYGRIHQFGGTPDMAPGPASLPARPYLGLSETDAELVEFATIDYLRRALDGAASRSV
jgi:phage virion morphogenesis protein